MRGYAVASGAMIATALAALAAPPSDAGRTTNPQLQAAAREYGFALLQVIAQIEQSYVRPVSRSALAEAALTGLYEAVRQPVPPSLRQDVQRVSDGELLGLLMRVRENLGDHDALRGARALFVSLNALPQALDQYCGVTGPKEFRSLDFEGTPQIGLEFPLIPPIPQFGGLSPDGLRLDDAAHRAARPSVPAGPVRILAVQAGSPAQKAGIRPNDLVVKVDGRPPEDPGFAAAFLRLLPTRAGTQIQFAALTVPIRLTLLRPGKPEPFTATIVPAPYRAESMFGVRRKPDGSWDYLLDSSARIGYIRVGLIQLHSNTEFAEALKALSTPSLRGLVLDLRWCPGGYLRPAATIARTLLAPDRVPIATQRDRHNKITPVPFYTPDIDATDFPVVVLVNGETSGGGELVAAALQDHGRAVVAGQRTVGKASVQEPLEQFGIPLKITTSMLVRPSGKNLARLPESKPEDDWGIRPDPGREIPASAELSRQLKLWWVLHSLRPAGSVEALPLDDPENDPQRQAAMQMLKALMVK